MTYTRLCGNWLQSYRDWIYDRSQLREELILWSGIYTIAATLKRNVAITRYSGYLANWDCYPFLYVIVVGPAGIGKTTAVRYSFDLTDQVPSLSKPPTFVTPEGLIGDLVNAEDNAVYLSIEELEDAFQKDYGRKMFGLLTSLYDGKTSIRQKTQTRDVEFADKPCLNMFAGTTPQWVADNIPPGVLNGGFGSRVIWLYVPSVRRRRMFYEEEMTKKDYRSEEKKLVADLRHIASIEGEFTISKQAREFIEDWNAKIPSNIKYKNIAGYLNRKGVFVHKIAMIWHVAYSDEMELNLYDYTEAVKLLEALEPNLPRIFEGVGKNDYSMEMREITQYILENPGVEDGMLRDIFKNAAPPYKLHELICGLEAAQIIRSEPGIEDPNMKIWFIKE